MKEATEELTEAISVEIPFGKQEHPCHGSPSD
jgi:hypothetical protein